MRKLILAPLAAGLLLLPAAAVAGPAENKAIAARVFLEKMGQGKFDISSELYGDGFVAHGARQDYDLKEDNESGANIRKAVPDLKVAVDRSVAEADMVAVHWTASGTNTVKGPPFFPGTGKAVKISGMTFFRFNDAGRIVEEWNMIDQLGMLQQLGVLRPLPPAAAKPRGEQGR
jgi:steroid delta-isomerase-like uncharacterized protein